MNVSWQPIETAPKDGTVIIGGWKAWNGKNIEWVPSPISWCSRDKGWICNGDYNDFLVRAPEYWMPIPDFPEEEALK